MSSDLRPIVNDISAGWVGGVAGILSSNFLDVWKVRQQTQIHVSPGNDGVRLASFLIRNSSWNSPLAPSASYYVPPVHVVQSLAKQSQTRTRAILDAKSNKGLMDAFRKEGISLFFRGAMGPVLGHAFIDAALFGMYGQAMEFVGQDRQNPSNLLKVGLAGGLSGAACTILETPIEVVKVRVQQSQDASKGSFRVAADIVKGEGLRGFYVGGVATALREGISGGIFFASYFATRKLIGYQSNSPPSSESSAPVEELFIASGVAGVISNLIPYPIDVIKTRIQTADPALGPVPSIREATLAIYKNSQALVPRTYESSRIYRWFLRHIFAPDPGGPLLPDGRHRPHPLAATWSIRVLGLSGFVRGLLPTLAGGLVYSAVMMTTFEKALEFIQTL